MDETTLETVDVAAEVERYFHDSSLVRNGPPELVLITGGAAVGKSRMRRARFACGYVNLDAGDIFIRLSQGRYIDFPSFLEEPMDMIGGLIAWQALRERRNIVCELIGAEVDPVKRLIDTYRALDYHIAVTGMTADLSNRCAGIRSARMKTFPLTTQSHSITAGCSQPQRS